MKDNNLEARNRSAWNDIKGVNEHLSTKLNQPLCIGPMLATYVAIEYLVGGMYIVGSQLKHK